MSWRVVRGDCIQAMAAMEPESVHAVVCDPPYGLEFMGKEWDSFAAQNTTASVQRGTAGGFGDADGKPWDKARSGTKGVRSTFKCRACGGWSGAFSDARRARQRPCACEAPDYDYAGAPQPMLSFQAWCEAWAREALRVLRPGGYMIAAGGSRTYHRLTCGIEDAGFEIRDCLTWHQGSGFPKSLDVTKALRALPACACDVPGEVGAVDPAAPTGSVGAGVGAEPGAMPLAGLAADLTGGVGPDIGSDAAYAITDMQTGVEQVVGNGAPVVLGASSVAPIAARDEVGASVGGVKVDPESLRDQVVGEARRPTAVDARSASDDLGGDSRPARPLVGPFAAAPGGVAGTGQPTTVGNGHAGTPAVDGDALPVAAEADAALGAGESPHDLKCGRCGGVRRDLIPDGLGTALKPATEFMVLARKPLSGTVAANVTTHGTGALNIDACRIGLAPGEPAPSGSGNAQAGTLAHGDRYALENGSVTPEAGRWPANVILDEHAAQVLDAQTGELHSQDPATRAAKTQHAWMPGDQAEPRAMYGDSGGASRFFATFPADRDEPTRFRYVAKASAAERSAGLDGFEEKRVGSMNAAHDGSLARNRPNLPKANSHPTVKPIEVMRWLVRLVTPPGGLVLDPFAGSGTTGIACVLEGFDFVGVEREPEYADIAEARIRWWEQHPEGLPVEVALAADGARRKVADTGQVSMFDLLGG